MKSALLVIDAQKVYTAKESDLFCKDSTRTIERINSLIDAFRKANRPVFLIRHVHKRDGSDLGRMFDFTGEVEEDFNFKEGDVQVEYDSRLSRPRGAIELTKNRYSAFAGTTLESILRQQNIDRVVICGFMTNFCCESSARYAHDADFHVDFVIDATGTPGTENFSEAMLRKTVADSIRGGIGRVFSTKQFLRQSVSD
ncbi:cysteine hydrolase [Candidatus Berkelbacteria bacterium]|nr:cysteine hydrolase [Candidatus Berkelbacteria bacterium]